MAKSKLSPESILEKVKSRTKRKTVSFTFDEEIYNEFQEACEREQVVASRVLEEFLKEFVDNLKSKK